MSGSISRDSQTKSVKNLKAQGFLFFVIEQIFIFITKWPFINATYLFPNNKPKELKIQSASWIKHLPTDPLGEFCTQAAPSHGIITEVTTATINTLSNSPPPTEELKPPDGRSKESQCRSCLWTRAFRNGSNWLNHLRVNYDGQSVAFIVNTKSITKWWVLLKELRF